MRPRLPGRPKPASATTGRSRASRGPASAAQPATVTDPPPAPPSRDPDLVLAGLHLRLGALALARVELATIAARGGLDRDALVDLAEVLWRTGDLTAAAEQANTALEAGDESVTATVIAAEALAGLGRPNEAGRLAGRALARKGDVLDWVFAGMPRGSIWPPDPSSPPPAAGTLFHAEQPGAVIRTMVVPGRAEFSAVAGGAGGSGPGLWDDDASDTAGALLPDPGSELAAGQAAFAAGDVMGAAVRFGLAIRLSPGLAPAVLDAIPPGAGGALDLIRGDAYRLVGHEREALVAYASAAAGGSAAPASGDLAPVDPDPAAAAPIESAEA
jgi:hypothetical protein